MCDGWQTRPPAHQWAEATEASGGAFRGNIGLRMGNSRGVIDCDAPTTTEHVLAGLAAMGLASVPTVVTPSGGRHFYLRLGGCPPGQNFNKLSAEVGPGELRFGAGAYVVAPCSYVDGARYRFTVASPEAIARLRVIDSRDLGWLLTTPTATRPALALDVPPVPLVRRAMPAKAERLLLVAGTASPGHELAGYASRSEAEAAACALLILAGWTLAEIADAFRQSEPGHYAEHARRDWYIERTYHATLNALAATPTRLELADVYANAQAQPWPGRSGVLDQGVFCGLLAIGWEHNTTAPRASVRDLAQYAGASRGGVSNALERLQVAGLVQRASGWQVCRDGTVKARGWNIRGQMSQFLAYGACQEGAPVADPECPGAAEVWAPARLGRSAGSVWRWLGAVPATVTGLADATGKSRPTVRRALQRLAVFDLAAEVDGGWVRGPADLVDVAHEVGAAKAAEDRRKAHKRQREGWCEWRQERRDAGTRTP